MLKVALCAPVLLVIASLATAENHVSESAVAPAAPVATQCRPGQSLDLGCAVRAVDADGDGSISPTELANLAVPGADPAPLQPTQATSLDFQDAATAPGSVLPVSFDRDPPQPLIPALFALGALLILLRRRPN